MEGESDWVLEIQCNECDGRGGDGAGEECLACDGTGYIPTELGEKILSLIRHNLTGRVSVLRSNRLPPGREQFLIE